MEKVKTIDSIWSSRTHTRTHVTRMTRIYVQFSSDHDDGDDSMSSSTTWIVNEIIFGFEKIYKILLLSRSLACCLTTFARSLLLFRHWKLTNQHISTSTNETRRVERVNKARSQLKLNAECQAMLQVRSTMFAGWKFTETSATSVLKSEESEQQRFAIMKRRS